MTSRRSKSRCGTAIAAIAILAVAGFLIGRHGAGDGAQARQDPPQLVAEGGGSGGQSASDRDVIRAAELVGPTEGWALTSSRLAWTTDGGGSWSNITPPAIKAGPILAARFDRSGHGVVVACREINLVPVPFEFFRTTDKGRTWRVSTLEGERPGSIGSVRASETDGKWWILVDEAGIDRTGTRLYESGDAGKSWRARPRPPNSGPFIFLSPDEGWIVGGQRSQPIYRTDHAGGSWEVAEIPLPGPLEPGEEVPTEPGGKVPKKPGVGQTAPEKEMPPEEGNSTGLEEGRNRRVVEYGLPGRGPNGVLLPVTITSPAGRSEVLLYELSDGRAWKKVSATKLARSAADSEKTTTFLAPGELLIQDRAAASAGPPALIRVSVRSGGSGPSHRGARATKLGRASGLPEDLPLHFADQSHGVAVQSEVIRIGAGGGSEGTQLFLTTDGGRNWSPSSARP